MGKTVHYFEVAGRTGGTWIVNRVEGYYKKNGMFKRSNTKQEEE
jgi:hypothetical protein